MLKYVQSRKNYWKHQFHEQISLTSIQNKMASTETKSKIPIFTNSSNEITGSDSDSLKLPQTFVVKYLGSIPTSHLWGMKHTREPIEILVKNAKDFLSIKSPSSSAIPNPTLPLLILKVCEDGIEINSMPQNQNPNFPCGKFPIETISYGVQDLMYSKVFAMIVVTEPQKLTNSTSEQPEMDTSIKLLPKLSELSKRNQFFNEGVEHVIRPYKCHAFVTNSRESAKNLTFALAKAFEYFSAKINDGSIILPKSQKFPNHVMLSNDSDEHYIDEEFRTIEGIDVDGLELTSTDGNHVSDTSNESEA